MAQWCNWQVMDLTVPTGIPARERAKAPRTGWVLFPNLGGAPKIVFTREALPAGSGIGCFDASGIALIHSL